MIRTRKLYVMVSRTDTRVAKAIRAVSRFPYNHVSVSLDPSLRSWYSYARYVQNAPLYSGFILETIHRFCAGSGDARVRIYCLEVPEKTARELEGLLPLAGNPDSGLIYNYFDALANAVGQQISVPGCHTCLSFACELLEMRCSSIAQLCHRLQPHLIYEGPLTDLVPDCGQRDELYFTRLSPSQAFLHTANQASALTARTLIHGFNCYRELLLRSSVR